MTAPRPRPPAAGNPPAGKEATRTFSKRITVASLALMFALAGYGTWSMNPDTADILTALGPWVLGLIATYMAVGYGDHRISRGLPSLSDVMTLAFSRGRSVRRPHHDEEPLE